MKQLATPLGDFARAFALLVTERIFFGTRAAAQTGIPWVKTLSGGCFGVYGSIMSDHDALILASQCTTRPSFVIVGHISESNTNWTIEIRVLDVAGQLENARVIEIVHVSDVGAWGRFRYRAAHLERNCDIASPAPRSEAR